MFCINQRIVCNIISTPKKLSVCLKSFAKLAAWMKAFWECMHTFVRKTLSTSYIYIHPASRGVAAHTAGLFRSVRGAKGGCGITPVEASQARGIFAFPPRGGLPKLRIFTSPPPWGLPKLGNFHFPPPWGLLKLGNCHFSPPWGLPKLGNFHFSPPWGLPKLGNFHFPPPWGLPQAREFSLSPRGGFPS